MFFEVVLNGECRICATPLHSFSIIRDQRKISVPTNELKRGDMIWLDPSILLTDGSLYVSTLRRIEDESETS